MRRRFWRAVFRYAAPRTGWARYSPDREAQMNVAYFPPPPVLFDFVTGKVEVKSQTWASGAGTTYRWIQP